MITLTTFGAILWYNLILTKIIKKKIVLNNINIKKYIYICII